MLWFLFDVALGAAVATGVCWWLWKSTADERAALKQRISDLEGKAKEHF